ncbi:MAG: serine/threonine-protein kinase, partial [Candidatus Obscuribacterales bacterium]|nr:serine/threonine-protein kinase [Candidatus Obscuribacterales bacterium]
MDFLDGKDLDTLIQDSGYLTPDEVVPIFTQICDAMTITHEQGIIHRDMKPGNIFIITKDNKPLVKLVDFGMAKFQPSADRHSQSLTQPGEVFGSPYYMSPEQCTGLKLDARSDIYSMGVLMYEALTGRPPFLADNMVEMAQMHIYEKPPTIAEAIKDPEFPIWMQNIIFKALEKNVNDRYQTTEEMKQALLSFNKFWLEKTGGESKPAALRHATTTRNMKDEVEQAKAILAKQGDKSQSGSEGAKQSTEQKVVSSENKLSGTKSADKSKNLMLIGGAALILVLGVALFVFSGHSSGGNTAQWKTLDEAGEKALNAGLLSEAEDDFSRAVKIADSNDDSDNPNLYHSMTGLASVYQRQGRYDMAENVFKQIMQKIEKAETPNSANLAPVLVKLGKLYCAMDRLDEAEATHKRAMNIIEASFGHDDLRMAEALNDYAQTKIKQGQTAQAKELQAQADRIRQHQSAGKSEGESKK